LSQERKYKGDDYDDNDDDDNNNNNNIQQGEKFPGGEPAGEGIYHLFPTSVEKLIRGTCQHSFTRWHGVLLYTGPRLLSA